MSDPTRFSITEIVRRCARIRRFFYEYSETKRVRTELEFCLESGQQGRPDRFGDSSADGDAVSAAKLSVLVAETGCGKSTLINEFIQEKRSNPNIPANAILRVNLPPNCTIKAMTEEFLDELRDPLSGRQSTEKNNTRRIVSAIRRTGVKLVFIDEFQHLYDKDRDKVIHATTDWLKSLLDKAGVEVVCVGLPDCHKIINSNMQLDRRTFNLIELKSLRWDDGDNTIEFRGLVRAFEEALEFGLPSGLHRPGIAKLIHRATKGYIGLVVQLLEQAVKVSMSRVDGDDRITTQDLEVAFQKRSPNKTNPFNAKQRPEIEAEHDTVTNGRVGKRKGRGQENDGATT